LGLDRPGAHSNTKENPSMKTLRPWRIMALVAVVALLVAACGDDEGGTTTTAATTSPDATEIVVNASEFQFSPANLQVPAGVPVTITLVNIGVVEHDITIDELGFHILANPGERVSETITIPAGIYEVYCAVPGHREAGMVGELVASG
jgi:uncharacterized cupredoxin-like copper-binding protein